MFIDCHTHVQFAAFKDDCKEVIERALRQGVGMVNVGTQSDTSESAVRLAHEFGEGVYATIGLHPIHTGASFHDSQELGGDRGFTSRGENFDYEYYKNLALNPKVVAIGECGLDYHRLERDPADGGGFHIEGDEIAAKKKQKEAFLQQIELAHDVKKPLMIHCRDAFGDLIKTLEENKGKLINPPGIIHFFTGKMSDAEKLLGMGFYFTFGGLITYIHDYDKIVKMIPLDKILSETDAPYVAPVPYRGKRNEPAYVIEVVKKLAELKNVSVGEIAAQILITAKQALGIS